MKLLKKIFSSCVWLQPITMALIVRWLKFLNSDSALTPSVFLTCLFLSMLPLFFLLAKGWESPNEEKSMQGREKAQHPDVPEEMLFDQPEGIVFGKYNKKYVCRPLSADGHVLLIGGSGSGKSSCLVIPTLLANPTICTFAIDIKGELSYKSTKYGDEFIRIFSPSDRSSWGYDPFYRLDEQSSSQDILETMQGIAFSLISLGADVKDPFWKTSARNLLIGLMLYYYHQGTTDFVSVIDAILGKPVKESIDAVIDESSPTSAEYRYIVQFKDMAEETLGGIVAEMNNHLVIFANDQDIRFAFQDNSRKVSPAMLMKGYSIYLSIKEEKLTAYYDVLQLIINQTFAELERRPEHSEPILMVIDELPRILSAGKLDRLLDGARTLRSRNVCLFLVTQSTEALMTAYSENEVADLVSNCPYISVLSATSSKTQKQVVEWCGKYRERKQSWGGGKEKPINVTYEEKDIVQQSDLMTLQRTGEAILISPYGYNRIRKVPYYKDTILAPIADENVKHNRMVQEIQAEPERKAEPGSADPNEIPIIVDEIDRLDY